MKTKTAGSKRKSIGAAGIEHALLLTFVALAMAGFRLSVKTSTGAIWNNTSTGLSSMPARVNPEVAAAMTATATTETETETETETAMVTTVTEAGKRRASKHLMW